MSYFSRNCKCKHFFLFSLSILSRLTVSTAWFLIFISFFPLKIFIKALHLDQGFSTSVPSKFQMCFQIFISMTSSTSIINLVAFRCSAEPRYSCQCAANSERLRTTDLYFSLQKASGDFSHKTSFVFNYLLCRINSQFDNTHLQRLLICLYYIRDLSDQHQKLILLNNSLSQKG